MRRRALGSGLWLLVVGAALVVYLVAPRFVSDFHSRDLAHAGVFFIAICRAEPAHRLHGPDLARPRRADGGRRLHDRSAGRARALARRLDDPARRSRRRDRRLPDRPPGAAALRHLPRARHLRVRGRHAVAPEEVLRPHGRRPGPAPARVRAHAGDRDQRHGDDLRPLDDPEPFPLLPDLGDRPRRLPARVADRARAARPRLPRGARQRDRGLLRRGQPRPLQDARVRAERRLRRGRRRAARDPGRDRQPAHVHVPALDPHPRRHRRRRARLAARDGARRALRPVPAGPLDAGLERPGRARFRLRRGDHPRDDSAPERCRRAAPPPRQSP